MYVSSLFYFIQTVVGAGSAGSVIAARLADGGKSVLLLEAGTGWNKNHLFTRLPTALSIPMHMKTFNYGFKAAPEEILDGRRITCPRGKGIGGSSSINGMVNASIFKPNIIYMAPIIILLFFFSFLKKKYTHTIYNT